MIPGSAANNEKGTAVSRNCSSPFVWWVMLVLPLGAASAQIPQDARIGLEDSAFLCGQPFRNVTLEMSLKPFKKNDEEYIRGVCRELFRQWAPLIRHADQVSVMLWTADGSEILGYTGDLSQRLEWARYLGNPNTDRPVGSEPDAPLSIHDRAFLYMENPPDYTLSDLRFIVQCLKEEGRHVTGKPVRVGATFDPGPEFAKSEFKYEKHPEICMAATMGRKSFVCCYALLHRDTTRYAGFPEGILEGTPFGTFFGRQAQHFLTDLGYDYIWFSNGLGFGLETWSSTGAIFTGESFDHAKLFDTRAKIIAFWKLFRQECPAFRIETRGTNLATGIDLAKDGVDLREIYGGGFNLLPPPNSPWAALDGDFGLELTGYLSRMAELPGEEYLFRFYAHDPWWINSPWLDRYGREPHDIYLPLACARVNRDGDVVLPTHLNLLTVDDSFGNMPAQVPNEIIPHLLEGRRDAPDEAGPFVWVYPFDEYHDWAYQDPARLREIFSGDWVIRQAINNGFPLNTVVSTTALIAAQAKQPHLFEHTVLVTIVPTANSEVEAALIRFVHQGGHLLIYGPITHAGPAFLDLLNLANAEPLEGIFDFADLVTGDTFAQVQNPDKVRHLSLVNGGGVESVVRDRADSATHVLATMTQQGQSRDVLVARSRPEWSGGKVVYYRGTHSNRYTGGRLLTPDHPEEFFQGPLLMRYVLSEFGYTFLQTKLRPEIKNPVVCIARSNNGFYFSGYTPDTTVTQRFRFPAGAPLLLGYETLLEDGCATYHLPRGWHRECRILVTQPADGRVGCNERHSNEKGVVRRLEVDGLVNATVIFFPGREAREENIRVYKNANYPWLQGRIAFEKGPAATPGDCYQVTDVTGRLSIAW
ncbi:MAG: hypothetical protein ACYC4B_21515 [Pirellulaceae bacterium]